MRGLIHYIQGDATRPIGSGTKFLVHVCNDCGVWRRGFVEALDKRWLKPRKVYQEWAESNEGLELGAIQWVQVEPELYVVNLIGQHDIRKIHGVPPIRYYAIQEGLNKVAVEAVKHKATVHMPKIGSGLAGGEWQEIERIIKDCISSRRLNCYIYTTKSTV